VSHDRYFALFLIGFVTMRTIGRRRRARMALLAS
jgi:hypothetical protein